MDVVSSLSRHKLTERNPLRAIVPITAVIWIANWGILVTRAYAMGDGDGLAGVIVRLTVCLIAAATCLLTFKILQHRVMTPAKRFLAAMGCSLPAVIFIAVVHELLWLNYTDYFSKRYDFSANDALISQCTVTGSPCQVLIQQAVFAVGTFIWVYVAWCAFYVVLSMAVDLRERERRLSIAEGMAREAQLSVLRFQLNPHFLFNTLNTLSGLIALDRKGQAEDLVINLSNFLRFSLKSGEEKLVTVNKEIEAQKMYGTVRIDEREGNLSLQLPHAPGLTARLDHWQHDTFLARFNDPSVEPIFVTFTFDPDGKVAGVRMKPASPLGGFDYEDLDLRPLSSPAGG